MGHEEREYIPVLQTDSRRLSIASAHTASTMLGEEQERGADEALGRSPKGVLCHGLTRCLYAKTTSSYPGVFLERTCTFSPAWLSAPRIMPGADDPQALCGLHLQLHRGSHRGETCTSPAALMAAA